MNVDTPSKKVTFAPDSKPPAESSTPPAPAPESQQKSIEEPETKVDGIIGKLEVHRSGAVKMCIGNSILMDVSTILNRWICEGLTFNQVTAATQPSFLQHAAYLDMLNKRLCVLGEVNKRFVVSPNVEALLSAMDLADRNDMEEAEKDTA